MNTVRDRYTKIILLRQGIDRGNQVQRFSDEEMTIEGIAQIQKITQLLEKQNISRIYSSPMRSSVQSSKIIETGLGVICQIEDDIRPRDMGIVQGMSYRDVQNKFSELLAHSTFGIDFKFPDGETNGDVYERAGKFLANLLKSTQGIKETILIISSPLVLNYIVYHLHNIGFKEGMLYIFEYGQFAILESQSNYFQLTEFRKSENYKDQ